MTTALLILAAVVLVAVLVGVSVQCCSSPVMWVFHLSCNTAGAVLNLLGLVLAAIAEGLTGSGN